MVFIFRGLQAAVAFAFVTSACGGPPPNAPAVAPEAATSLEEPEPGGDLTATLDILAGEPTEILLDGKPIGTTPIQRYKVSPGEHDVTFVDAATGNRTMGVTVAPGDAQTVQSDPPPTMRETPPTDSKGDKKK